MHGARSSASGWLATATPNTAAAARSRRSVARSGPLSPRSWRERTRHSQLTSSRTTSATSTRWSAWTSAWVAMLQAIGVVASPRPAAAATASGVPRRRAMATVTPAAVATRTAERRFIRNAGSPNGANTNEASQPSRTYAGKPVGCITPSSGPTVCASAVSQNQTPGSSAARASSERHEPHRDHDQSLGDPGVRMPARIQGGHAHPRRRRLTIPGDSPRSRPTG